MTDGRLQTRCAIVGGGPAGVMLGYLLARAGVDVIVLEKHKDFLRDFRGDTVHPSTLDVLGELGLLDRFLERPHQELSQIHGRFGEVEVALADFRHVPTRRRFIAFMPQWDFLDFLVQAARPYPGFRLMTQARGEGLLEADGRVIGVRASTPGGPVEIEADLVVGADGRHSVMRQAAGFKIADLGAPMDVLWMRLSKRPGDPPLNLGRVNYGRLLVTIDRGDYWQCAFLIRKGGYQEVRARGLEALKADVARVGPFLADRLDELQSWDDVSLLTVTVDRLEQWRRPGLLCIGDAAHAMSPIGGVGINLAIQDAVATANLLAAPLRNGRLSLADLQAVQDRRMPPTRATQAMQLLIQKRVIDPLLGDERPFRPPWFIRAFNWLPPLRRIPARLIGVGARPEHVSPGLAALFVDR